MPRHPFKTNIIIYNLYFFNPNKFILPNIYLNLKKYFYLFKSTIGIEPISRNHESRMLPLQYVLYLKYICPSSDLNRYPW